MVVQAKPELQLKEGLGKPQYVELDKPLLALTKDYFQAQWGPLYRILVPSVAMVTAIAVLLLFVLN